MRPPIFFSLLLAVPFPARAGYELLAEFPRPGAQPMAPLLPAADGNWYTTTAEGGAFGRGAVIRITAGGGVSAVHSFDVVDGAAPVAGLTAGTDGSLYGVTGEGGSGGFGTAFKLTTGGQFTLLTSFTGTAGVAKGAVPQQLVRHSDGNFYGTTQAGGAAGLGTVFRMTSTGAVTTLVEFTGGTGAVKGSTPTGPLTVSGNTFYGVTSEGGAGGFGVIYSVTTGGAFTLMAEFTGISGGKPGANPAGGLFLNTDGALYGTTEFGGAGDLGTAFKITTGAVFTSLRTFADATGSQPAGTLVKGADGQLYGGTAGGGTGGLGTLFKMTTAGAYTVLTHFTGTSGAAPGAAPRSGVVAGTDGNFYAAVSAGGPGDAGVVCRVSAAGVYGLVASLSTPSGWAPAGAPAVDGNSFLIPMHFGGANGGGAVAALTSAGSVSAAAALGGAAGSNPAGALVKHGADFFGVALRGGTADRGTLFKYNAQGVTVVSAAATSSGSLPEGPLTVGADGTLYGTAREGGGSGKGTVYKVSGTGVRTRLLSFTGTAGAARGSRPRGIVALAANTSYYGLTETGGAADTGTLFRLSAAGTFTAMAEFTAAGPRLPLGGLALGADGSLYGTTSRGGSADGGTLLRVVPSTNTWSVVADFSLATGTVPAGAVTVAADGAVYGLTTSGGTGAQGTLWRYTASGGLQALVSFTGSNGAAPGSGGLPDGDSWITGGVTIAADGTLFGVTPAGGAGGGGTVFRYSLLTPFQSWKLQHLGSADAPDTADPDQDGLSTLAEYALSTLPQSSDVSQFPVASATGGNALEFIVPRDPVRNDITVTVEASDTLEGPWTALAVSANGTPFSGPGYVSGDADTAGVKSVLVRDLFTPGTASRRFMRLRVVH